MSLDTETLADEAFNHAEALFKPFTGEEYIEAMEELQSKIEIAIDAAREEME